MKSDRPSTPSITASPSITNELFRFRSAASDISGNRSLQSWPLQVNGKFLLLIAAFYRCELSRLAPLSPACPHHYAQGRGMASYREMDAVGRDRARFVSLAKHCLAFPDINEWERKFLDSLIRGNEIMVGPPEQLSLRQAERLLSIRDEYELHSELHGGF